MRTNLRQLTVTDTNGNVATGTVTIEAQATFALWQATRFLPSELSNTNISGALADPDLDGINNRFEYAFGLDPRVPNTATNGLPRASLSDGTFTLTYTRFKPASDLSLAVEMSSDLQSWAPVAPSHVVDDGLLEVITIERDSRSATARFFRFKVD